MEIIQPQLISVNSGVRLGLFFENSYMKTTPTNSYAKVATVAIKLDGLFGEDDLPGPKWVQVTREGNFPGYLGGLKPFSFTRANLEQMVANVKAHPSFVAGADGIGTAQVIPWDFNHASEANPASGNLPATGAPASGWTLDMEVRTSSDAKAELWALTDFLEPARSYVKTGAYQWASVAVAFDAVNGESGQNVGAMVTSIALTNTPFVEGMAQLVAQQEHLPPKTTIQARRFHFEPARDPADAINMMREMFALPETAGAAEVMGQVAIVQQWITSGTAPLGTNAEELIGNMRIILNLPALSPQVTVLDEASRSIQALLEEQATAAGLPAQPSGDEGMVPEPPNEVAARRQEKDMNEFLKLLAARLEVRENEDSITNAVKELSELRDGLVTCFGLSRDGVKVILDSAKDGVDAKTKLLGIFEALGVQDSEAALAKVAATLESAAKLKEAMPELENLKVEKEASDKAAAETDVDSAIAASNGAIPANMRNTLLLHRTSDPKQFAEDYPKAAPAPAAPAIPANVLQLTSKVAATQATPPGGNVIDLTHEVGDNPTARAKAFLSANNANWVNLSNNERFEAALALRNRPDVIDNNAHSAS